MQIKVNDVSSSVKKGKSGAYSVLTVNYEKDGEGKSRKITSYDQKMFKFFKDMKEGSVVNVKVEKDDKDFWQWTEAEMVEATAAPKGASKSGAVETNRDLRIVRQSALKAASTLGKTPDEVIGIAEIFVQWVFSEPTAPKLGKGVEITEGEDDEGVE